MREKPRDKERLHHILESIGNIGKFTKNVSLELFLKDKMMQFAITKNFEIIGEAAFCTTKDLRTDNPEIDWKGIIGFRHVLIHDYYNINLETLWNIKENKLPQLKKQIALLHKKLETKK